MGSLTLLTVAMCLITLPAYSYSWNSQPEPQGYDYWRNYADWYNSFYGRPNGLSQEGQAARWQPRSFGTSGDGRVPPVEPDQGTQNQETRAQEAHAQSLPRTETPEQSKAGKGTPAKDTTAGNGGAGQRLPVPEDYVNPQDAVAFSALVTTDQFFYKAGSIVYDKIITNIGGGYNSEYGVFTAPVPGIYFVSYHAASNPNSPKPAHLDLVMNHKVINSAKGSGVSGTPSNSAVLFLDQFDTLRINARAGTSVGCGSSSRFCSFNVVLIKEGKFTDQKIPRAFPMDKW